MKAELPKDFAATGTKLVSVLYKDALHQSGATTTNHRQATASLSLKLFSGETELSVTNLKDDIIFSFPVNSSDSTIISYMQEI